MLRELHHSGDAPTSRARLGSSRGIAEFFPCVFLAATHNDRAMAHHLIPTRPSPEELRIVLYKLKYLGSPPKPPLPHNYNRKLLWDEILFLLNTPSGRRERQHFWDQEKRRCRQRERDRYDHTDRLKRRKKVEKDKQKREDPHQVRPKDEIAKNAKLRQEAHRECDREADKRHRQAHGPRP